MASTRRRAHLAQGRPTDLATRSQPQPNDSQSISPISVPQRKHDSRDQDIEVLRSARQPLSGGYEQDEVLPRASVPSAHQRPVISTSSSQALSPPDTAIAQHGAGFGSSETEHAKPAATEAKRSPPADKRKKVRQVQSRFMQPKQVQNTKPSVSRASVKATDSSSTYKAGQAKTSKSRMTASAASSRRQSTAHQKQERSFRQTKTAQSTSAATGNPNPHTAGISQLALLEARALHWAYLTALAEHNFSNQEQDACRQLSGASALIDTKRAELATLSQASNERRTQSAVRHVVESLDTPLEKVCRILPEVKATHSTLARAVAPSVNTLRCRGVLEERSGEIYACLQELESTVNALLTQLQPQKAAVEACVEAFSGLATLIQTANQEAEQFRDHLVASRSASTRTRSLLIQRSVVEK